MKYELAWLQYYTIINHVTTKGKKGKVYVDHFVLVPIYDSVIISKLKFFKIIILQARDFFKG